MKTVRFAPSPTGHVHIGNMRTALFNWLYAKRTGGQFILRFDDTDVIRSKQEYADEIVRNLEWLGVTPNRIEYQSKRKAIHDEATQKLKDLGLLYPCYETADELDRKRKLRLTKRLPPIYGRDALDLTDADHAAFIAEGRMPHWRFMLPNFDVDPKRIRHTKVHWNDLIRGSQTVDLSSLSDPVLIREDGSYLYTLPSVVDDIDMGVTAIIRGDDHVTNTAVQLSIFDALGSKRPECGHHNLLTTASGEGLSKRTGALSITSLREDGYEPRAVAALAVLTGTSDMVAVPTSLDAMAETFDMATVSKSAAKFDPEDLKHLTAQITHELSFDAAQSKLEAIGIKGDKAEAFWLAVRSNCTTIKDALPIWSVLTSMPEYAEPLPAEDIAFVQQAFDLFPTGELTAGSWKVWTDVVKSETGRKGRGLFMPLRIALTGSKVGPEIAGLLPLLGREEILARRP